MDAVEDPPADCPNSVTLSGSPQGRDVGLHPVQRHNLVLQAPVGEGSGVAVRQRRMGQPPECPQAVVDRDHHDIAGPRQPGADRARGVAAPGAPGAAMQPHHHGPPAARIGRPNVQEQAILALERDRLVEPGRAAAERLDGSRAGPAAVARLGPARGRAGGGVAQRSDWRGGIGQAEKGRDPLSGGPAHRPASSIAGSPYAAGGVKGCDRLLLIEKRTGVTGVHQTVWHRCEIRRTLKLAWQIATPVLYQGQRAIWLRSPPRTQEGPPSGAPLVT